MGFKSIFNKKKKKKHLKMMSSLSLLPHSPPLPLHSPRTTLVTEDLEYVFKKFDANDDGKISVSKLDSLMKSLGSPMTEEELNKLIREVYSNSDGHINLVEFNELNTKGLDLDEVLDNLKDALSIFDLDGNGSITVKELKMVMASLTDMCSIDECQKMIVSVNGNDDDMITFDEFQTMMNRNMDK